jgi:hypothetical protein
MGKKGLRRIHESASAKATAVREARGMVQRTRIDCLFKDKQIFSGVELRVTADGDQAYVKLDDVFDADNCGKGHVVDDDEFACHFACYDKFEIPCPPFAHNGVDLQDAKLRAELRMHVCAPRWSTFPFLVHAHGQSLRHGDVVLLSFATQSMCAVIAATVQACVPFIGVFVARRSGSVPPEVRDYVVQHAVPPLLIVMAPNGKGASWVPQDVFVARESMVLAVLRGPHWPHGPSRPE